MRSVAGALAGYALFAASAVALFQLSGIEPHGASTTGFRALAIACGIAFGAAAGLLAAKIGRPHGALAGAGTATLIALAGAISLAVRPGAGAVWTQLASIFLFAPAALVAARVAAGRGRGP